MLSSISVLSSNLSSFSTSCRSSGEGISAERKAGSLGGVGMIPKRGPEYSALTH